MPSRAICGGFLLIIAVMNDIHISSTHIGSLPCVAGKSGRQVHPLVPARSVVIWPPSVAGQSMIVAAAEIEAGAAFIASAIFCSLVIGACATACAADPTRVRLNRSSVARRDMRSSGGVVRLTTYPSAGARPVAPAVRWIERKCPESDAPRGTG